MLPFILHVLRHRVRIWKLREHVKSIRIKEVHFVVTVKSEVVF